MARLALDVTEEESAQTTRPFGVARPVGLADAHVQIRETVKGAARARLRARSGARIAHDAPQRKLSADAVLPPPSGNAMSRTTEMVVCIGASTGGTEALRVVLEHMPADAPAVVMTQHLPASFSTAFAERLNRHSAMLVREASDGEAILPGHAYLPPGGQHLRIIRDGARWRCRIDDGPPVNRHKPAVDVLFRSVAANAGPNAVGAILTGMGDDGARGLLEMLQAGAPTLVQDEASSVVWGMPGAAYKLGAAQEVVPLERVAERLIALSAQAR